MNRVDAIGRVKEFLGSSVEPESATFVERPDGRRYWSVVYRQEAFRPEEEVGVAMDGPFVLRVDDITGEVSVLG